MLQLPKLLVIIAVLVAAWYVKRWLATTLPQRRPAAPPQPQRAIEDLVACRTCGAYVAAACARPDCPQR
jgi:hypothetical protein